ncbi:hypothetical protein EVAR_101816_1 [Eumeta japonica]|uniref:Uncharacterized protein n=1 Tax=Eumeta variegata TaxID=151549 RepID=A0A4C1SQ67_EUMVA|nr:hypothetical protein EVAR_101816_1 [Eumeta japonica]
MDKLEGRGSSIPLGCSQDPNYQEIEQFLQYVESRPYKYSVCGLLDVGAGLLLGLIGLGVTYFVVVVQFSYFLQK